jgi:hypothetical protein
MTTFPHKVLPIQNVHFQYFIDNISNYRSICRGKFTRLDPPKRNAPAIKNFQSNIESGHFIICTTLYRATIESKKHLHNFKAEMKHFKGWSCDKIIVQALTGYKFFNHN